MRRSRSVVPAKRALQLTCLRRKNPAWNTIVCDGKGHVVPQVGNYGGEQNKKCAGACFIEHELSHKADADQASPGVCKGKAAGLVVDPDNPEQLFKSEAKAWQVFVSCIEGKLESDYKNGGCCQNTLLNLYQWSLDYLDQYTNIVKSNYKK